MFMSAKSRPFTFEGSRGEGMGDLVWIRIFFSTPLVTEFLSFPRHTTV